MIVCDMALDVFGGLGKGIENIGMGLDGRVFLDGDI